MATALPYRSIPDYPATVTSGAVIARFLDGLGFRFHWATEGLEEADYDFRPDPGCMSIGELIGHVWGLSNWIGTFLFEGRQFERPSDVKSLRNSALTIVAALRETFAGMSDEDLLRLEVDRGRPFWNLLNGPVADALTHTGQINTLRRLAGNPPLKANVFLGLPPAPTEEPGASASRP